MHGVLALILVAWPVAAQAAPASAVPLGKGLCKPDCRGKACGDNGCGGSCGTCGKSSACHKNRCIKAPKGDPCVAMKGRWKGQMPAVGRHPVAHMRGRVWGTAKACRALFYVSYKEYGRTKTVIEYFTVTIWGPPARRRARFACTKVTPVTPGVMYSKDTFVGTLDVTLTRFKGTCRDTSGSSSPVWFNKK